MSATPCQRCGKPCRAGVSTNPKARPFRKVAQGLCPNCSVAEFIQSIDVLMYGINLHGIQAVLSNPAIQEQFGRVLEAGDSELKASEIDWQEVIKNWDLPFPEKTRPPRRSLDS